MKHKIFFVVAILINIVIFTQSLLTAELSSKQSGLIVNILHPFIIKIGIDINIDTFSLLVRKLAHFTEFFFLGIFWYLVYSKYLAKLKVIAFTLFHGLITALADETIQLFTKGRSGAFSDVIIDFSGVLLAVLLIHLMTNTKLVI